MIILSPLCGIALGAMRYMVSRGCRDDADGSRCGCWRTQGWGYSSRPPLRRNFRLHKLSTWSFQHTQHRICLQSSSNSVRFVVFCFFAIGLPLCKCCVQTHFAGFPMALSCLFLNCELHCTWSSKNVTLQLCFADL